MGKIGGDGCGTKNVMPGKIDVFGVYKGNTVLNRGLECSMSSEKMLRPCLEQGVVICQTVLDVEKVFCSQLAQSEDAHEVDLSQIP